MPLALALAPEAAHDRDRVSADEEALHKLNEEHEAKCDDFEATIATLHAQLAEKEGSKREFVWGGWVRAAD